MNHIIIDFEFTPITSRYCKEVRNEIIEIGAVKLDDKFNFIDNFTVYVHPIYSTLSENCIFLTGITQKKLAGAVKFAHAVSCLSEWIGCEPFEIYEWSCSDHQQLSGECRLKNCSDMFEDLINKKWIDLQAEFSKRAKLKSSPNLENAVSMLDMYFEGQAHDAFNDAYNTARILQIMKNENEFENRFNKNSKQSSAQKSNGVSTLGDLLGDKLNLIYELVG